MALYRELLNPASLQEHAAIITESGHSDHVIPLTKGGNGTSVPSLFETQQRPDAVSQKSSVWARLNETWIFELLKFTVAIAFLSATIVRLWKHDGQRVPRWPITLNASISLLGAIASSTTISVASTAIAQLKWIWFTQRSRPLLDLQTFQRASSAIGAVDLLRRLRACHFAALGTIPIILGSIWGTFTQNLIHYYDETVQDVGQIARLARCVEYTAEGPPLSATYDYSDPLLSLAMKTALVSAPNTDVNLPTYVCNSGNCTWDPVATFAFYSLCVDATPSLMVNCSDHGDSYAEQCWVTLPNNGTSLYYSTSNPGLSSLMNITAVSPSQALVYKNYTTLFPNVFQSITVVNFGKPEDDGSGFAGYYGYPNFTATECSLNPCVLSLQASVIQGKYSETVIDIWMENQTEQSASLLLRPPWGSDRGVADNQSFGLGEKVYYNWKFSGEGFPSKTITGWVNITDGTAGVGFNGGEMMQSIFYAKYNASLCGSPNNDTFACAMKGMSDAMTKTLRDSAIVTNGTNSTDMAVGKTFVVTTFIHIEWLWILLPITVWALSLVTWIGTALQTRRWRVPKWRDNQLPLVFLFHDSGNNAALEHEYDSYDNSNRAFEARARDLKIKLIVEDTGRMRLAGTGWS